eukprot:2302485-Amphidinium_carterae.2
MFRIGVAGSGVLMFILRFYGQVRNGTSANAHGTKMSFNHGYPLCPLESQAPESRAAGLAQAKDYKKFSLQRGEWASLFEPIPSSGVRPNELPPHAAFPKTRQLHVQAHSKVSIKSKSSLSCDDDDDDDDDDGLVRHEFLFK